MFDHAFTVAFRVQSAKQDGSDITAEQFSEALRLRIDEINDSECGTPTEHWHECVGAPFDSFEI